MFSVKHISLGGVESIYEAEQVRFSGRRKSQCSKPAFLRLFGPLHGVPTDLFGGTVFVMNHFGKTVSRYDLGASEVPITTFNEVDRDSFARSTKYSHTAVLQY